MPPSDPSKWIPNQCSLSPFRPSRARNAAPTTTVGMTKGTIISARSNVFPLKENRAKTYAAGTANSIVSAVDATACQSVNHTCPGCPDRQERLANRRKLPATATANTAPHDRGHRVRKEDGEKRQRQSQ